MDITAGHIVIEKDAEVVAAWVDAANASNVTVEVEGTIEHAHAASNTAASTLNGYTDKGNVTWDYDGNTAQNSDASVYHHVDTSTNTVVGDKIGSTTTNKSDVKYEAEAEIIYTISVNGTFYKTLGDVFSKCSLNNGNGYDLSGDKTIVFYKDIEDCGLWIAKDNSNVVIDFNGHTYTVTSSVGSQGTTSQAMHFEGKNTNVTLKNGTFLTKAGVSGIKMAMQDYVKFTAINMTFDFTNIPVTKYDTDFYKVNYPSYYMHEVGTFNNNKSDDEHLMTLENCTLNFPTNSNYSIGAGKLKVINSTINGYVTLSEGECCIVDNKSFIKGVKAYFDGETISSDTSTNEGYTTYNWISNN